MNCVNDLEVKFTVASALKEDIGKRDITTEDSVPKNKAAKAAILAKEDFVVCGLNIASLAFRLYDKNIKFKPLLTEGAFAKKGQVIAAVSGKARSILTSERVALNLLSLLCGISTKTRLFVEAVKPHKVKIIDTRKTIPGLRILQKYAVRMGGGYNHRMRLDEMYLVKDNHLAIIRDLSALKKLKRNYDLEIEVKNLKEFKDALKLSPEIIMLDNMSVGDIRKAVRIRNSLSGKSHQKTPKLEASGGITLKNVREVASCGVDMISVGALTHSVKSVDISLEIQ